MKGGACDALVLSTGSLSEAEEARQAGGGVSFYHLRSCCNARRVHCSWFTMAFDN